MPLHARSLPGGRTSSPESGALQARTAERFSGQHLARAGRGKSLPDAVRAKMERALGHDFSRVRIHEGSHAESLGAIAYTRGTDLHFAPGRYSPATRTGQELIGHELAHVVQQQAGRVAVPQGKGAPINADPALEAEADRLGRLAAQSAVPAGTAPRGGDPGAARPAAGSFAALQPATAGGPVQRQHGPEEGNGVLGSGLSALWAGFIARNLQQQRNGARGGPVDPTSRLGALNATRAFRPGQTGFGVHANIAWIHALLGGAGQSDIGTLFGSPLAQRFLARPAGSAGNRGLGILEHRFWRQRLAGLGAGGAATPGERFGGVLGSAVFPGVRASLQHQAGLLRGLAPRAAVSLPPHLAIAGLLGFSAFNQRDRLRRLRES